MTDTMAVIEVNSFSIAVKKVGDKYIMYLPLGGRLFMLIDSNTGDSKQVDEREITNAVSDIVAHLGNMCKVVPQTYTGKVGHA